MVEGDIVPEKTTSARRSEGVVHSVNTKDAAIDVLKRVVIVADEEKLDILRKCVIGFCRRTYSMLDLAKEFCAAGLEGFTIMRISRAMVLIMFHDLDSRKCLLGENVLDLWLENVSDWSPMMKIPNRRVWLSIPSGDELSPEHDEQVELQVGDDIFVIRVAELEEVHVAKCDCCCMADEVLCSGSLSQGGENTIDSPAASDCDTSLVHLGMQRNSSIEDTVVPNSVSMVEETPSHIARLWEDNWRVDDRVIDLLEVDKAFSSEEGAGLVMRSEECEKVVDVMQVLNEMRAVNKAISDLNPSLDVGGDSQIGPRQERIRANKVLTYYYKGQPKRVRKISKINCCILSPSS
ncbi:hypothetical protein V6N11_002244 [Hibiscus sabdariffa]|uniref:DUF4283 domain-containing protein n=1 Tax=Hibiscus sabdariffa TaxID=183260 RepID=A0ABR2QUX8_9ROSI